jgi:hypothetical protein
MCCGSIGAGSPDGPQRCARDAETLLNWERTLGGVMNRGCAPMCPTCADENEILWRAWARRDGYDHTMYRVWRTRVS